MTPAHTQAHQTSALEAIKELLEANFLEAEKSVSHAVTDEIELRVSDPNQPDLDLGREQTQQALCGS